MERSLRSGLGKAVPDVDPLDGGVNARLLILLETPGPRVLGTGFVSRDNPDGTAANMFRFLTQRRHRPRRHRDLEHRAVADPDGGGAQPQPVTP